MERKHRFEELFADYSSDIVAYCRWRASSISAAEDAASEVFLTAWRRLDRLPDGDGARIWLYATARRVLANQHRSRRRRLALRERLVETASASSDWPAFEPATKSSTTRSADCTRVTARSCCWRSGRG